MPIALGLVTASGVSMMRMSDRDLATFGMSLATAIFVMASRRNPMWALAGCVCVSVALAHARG